MTLRPATPGDADALYAVHVAAMHAVVEATWGSWDESWQRAHFDAQFDPLKVQVIERDGHAVGLLDVEPRDDELWIARIELHPDVQGMGIGTALMRGLIEEAARHGMPVRLQVLRANSGARALCGRLGFLVVGSSATHELMERV